VGRIVLSSNSISVDFDCPAIAAEALKIVFQEQSGWLVAGMQQ